MGRTIELTEEQLQNLIASTGKAAAEAALAAYVPQQVAHHAPPPMTPDERVASQAAAMRTPAQQVVSDTIKGCRSFGTGSTFDAVQTHGVVQTLAEYTYPEGIERHQAEGGLVPNGMPIRREEGGYSREFLTWRWETFYREDLRTYVGKPLPEFCRPKVDAAAE